MRGIIRGGRSEVRPESAALALPKEAVVLRRWDVGVYLAPPWHDSTKCARLLQRLLPFRAKGKGNSRGTSMTRMASSVGFILAFFQSPSTIAQEPEPVK